jgi:hypothetical protein
MTWNRLEGSGVSADLTPGLEAHVADPLWFLARQWQTGEFAGEDAASPVEIMARVAWHAVGEVRLGRSVPCALDPGRGAPLEARVECEPVLNGPGRVRLAAETALQLLRLANAAGADAGLSARLRRDYPLVLPADDGLDPRGRRELMLLAARTFDGIALSRVLRAGVLPDAAIAAVAPQWLAVIDALFVEPPADHPEAWDPERMEYSFAVAAPSFAEGTQLEARCYSGGNLDWQTFDLGAQQAPMLAVGASEARIATVPIPLHYPGMPAPRWWTFEDGTVYWGDIQGGPEDLARYLVAAFATVYGDDWSLVPVDLPRGILAQVTSVELRDSFGRPHTIQATAALDHARVGAGRKWHVFELTNDTAPTDGLAPLLLLPASLPVHEEGEPREEVLLLRDEAANLGWAVERIIESPAGRRAFRGREAPPAQRSRRSVPGTWGYDLSSAVPPHYVPLVPVRLDGTAAIRLQRGRLATASGSAGARGLLLEPERRLLLHEEEVLASGVLVTRAYQVCRSPDGSLIAWSGRRKRPGARSESPGLAYDVLRTTTPQSAGPTGASDARATGREPSL